MRQTRCVRRACTGHARRHSSSFFFYPYRPALRRLLLPLSSCRGRSRSKKRRRGARAREVRERARSRVTILTVSRSCIGGATRENVVGGAGLGPSELSVCLSDPSADGGACGAAPGPRGARRSAARAAAARRAAADAPPVRARAAPTTPAEPHSRGWPRARLFASSVCVRVLVPTRAVACGGRVFVLRLPHDHRASFLRTAPECVLEHIISVTWAADSHSNVIL